MEEIHFHVQMRVKTMYRFLMHHGYSGAAGVINIVISGGALVLLLLGVADSASGKIALAVIAALFTIINPIYLYYKAAKQVKLTPMFAKPFEYCINSEGISVSQGEESLLVAWSELRRVVETGKDFYIYLSLTRAYIFPKEDLGAACEKLRSAIVQYTDERICKHKLKA